MDSFTMMTNDGITAISGVVAIVVSVCTLIWQTYQARSVHQVGLMLDMLATFNEEKLCKKRSTAAQFLSVHASCAPDDPKWDVVSDVIDFFQVVGTLGKAGYVDRSLIHNFFYFWLSHYYPLCEKHIRYVRNKSPITWGNACWLYLAMKSYDVRHNNGALSSHSSDEHLVFLTWEMSNTCDDPTEKRRQTSTL